MTHEYNFTKNINTTDLTQLQEGLCADSSTDGVTIYGISNPDTSNDTIVLTVDVTLTAQQQTDIQTYITTYVQPFPIINWLTVPYAYLREEQPTGVHAGTMNAGWNTRNLNMASGDLVDAGVVTLSGNQFTLKEGSYLISGVLPAYRVYQHTARIKTIGGVNVLQSDNGMSRNEQTVVSFNDRLVVSETTTYVLEHWAFREITNTGMGIAAGTEGLLEIYAYLRIARDE